MGMNLIFLALLIATATSIIGEGFVLTPSTPSHVKLALVRGAQFATASSSCRMISGGALRSSADDTTSDVAIVDYRASIDEAISILHRAAETKQEDSDQVYLALANLEKLMRQKVKDEGASVAEEMRDALNGSWQLVFTTGTAKSQSSIGRINYIPIKAVQTFDTSNWKLTNGIYVCDFAALKFFGSFTFDLTKRKLEFDFDTIAILQLLEIPLKQGDAAQIGDSTGLGQKYQTGRRPFFNWINADGKIATARGGGGGLALWKRVDT